ncbi:RDD family protein [Syntrophotalea acetylenica]|uniref:RDD family protein n=1 Tax=Syntrophotalea acetylenica TaxID=29542 RepID=UPI00090AC23B|nr:RDD family protein [Syntrophotalea acetylenica]APG43256.1 hypothetical protein A6070_03235 [Syntrophotalea acetylenica]
MTITCPYCGFSQQVPPDRIPAEATEATCPRCQASFALPVAPAKSLNQAADKIVSENPEITCPAASGDLTDGQTATQEGPAAFAEPRKSCPTCGQTQAAPLAAVYAGFWIRAAAAAIDSIAAWILQLTLSLLLGAVLQLIAPDIEATSVSSIVMLALFSSAVGMAYYVVFTGACGQTPGKMLLRLKVVRRDGQNMTYGRAALREILGKFVSGITLGIGYLMVAFDAHKQGLHDKIADTCVIHL